MARSLILKKSFSIVLQFIRFSCVASMISVTSSANPDISSSSETPSMSGFGIKILDIVGDSFSLISKIQKKKADIESP